MLIGCPKETTSDEKRVALTPDSALQLQKLGCKCMIETGAGFAAGFSDIAYEKAGVSVTFLFCSCRVPLQTQDHCYNQWTAFDAF